MPNNNPAIILIVDFKPTPLIIIATINAADHVTYHANVRPLPSPSRWLRQLALSSMHYLLS